MKPIPRAAIFAQSRINVLGCQGLRNQYTSMKTLFNEGFVLVLSLQQPHKERPGTSVPLLIFGEFHLHCTATALSSKFNLRETPKSWRGQLRKRESRLLKKVVVIPYMSAQMHMAAGKLPVPVALSTCQAHCC